MAFSISAANYIGNDLQSGSTARILYRSSILSNGYHWSIPYYTTNVLRTNATSNLQTVFSLPTGSHDGTTQKWVGAQLASNGRIYASPHNAWGPLIIDTNDPVNPTLTYIPASTATPTKWQTRGIALNDYGNGYGEAYFSTYSQSEVWRRMSYDPSGNERILSSVAYSYPLTADPFYMYRSSISATDHPTANFYNRYWGAVNGNNDKIYGIPFGAAFVMTIALSTNEVNFLTDTALSANAPMWGGHYDAAGPYGYYLYSPQWNKYRGGVLASNGCIYSHGSNARSVLKIDTSDDSVSEIAYPQTIISAMTGTFYRSFMEQIQRFFLEC